MRIICMKSATLSGKELTRASKKALLAVVEKLSEMGFSGAVFYSADFESKKNAEFLKEARNLNIQALESEFLPEARDGLREELNRRISELPENSDVLIVVLNENAVKELCEIYHPENYKSSVAWDCSLSQLYSDSGETFVFDASHISEEYRMSFGLPYSAYRDELENSIRAAKFFSKESSGGILLHIGDTHSAHYEYYRKLILAVKPDVIVHTGDFADELKAGRVESARTAWRREVPRLFDIMKASGARIITVIGNNDVQSVLADLPEFNLCEPNTVIELCGKRICLTHEVWRIDKNVEADIFLYGHGPTGDERTPLDNEREGRLYFNAFWGASVHSLSDNRHLILKRFNL